MKAIARYTVRTWGREQALRYNDDLLTYIGWLAESPMVGRACNSIRQHYYRIEHGSHVIFYRQNADDILVSRILHRKMLPVRHTLE